MSESPHGNEQMSVFATYGWKVVKDLHPTARFLPADFSCPPAACPAAPAKAWKPLHNLATELANELPGVPHEAV